MRFILYAFLICFAHHFQPRVSYHLHWISTYTDTRSNKVLSNSYRVIRQAFWKIISMNDPFLLSLSSFLRGACTGIQKPRNSIRPHSTIEQMNGQGNAILTTDFFFSTPIQNIRWLMQRKGQTIASLDTHLLIVMRKEETSLYSNLIDEALIKIDRHIALAFQPIERKDRHKKALKYRISQVSSRWEGFYLARLEYRRWNETVINIIYTVLIYTENTLKSLLGSFFWLWI